MRNTYTTMFETSLLYRYKQTVHNANYKQMFLKAHFFFFFVRSMGGVDADRVLQSFKPTDS